MDKLVELVQLIKDFDGLIDSVSHMCSNKSENFVLIALKQEKTRIFKEAQELAESLLFPAEIEIEVQNDSKKSKKVAKQ